MTTDLIIAALVIVLCAFILGYWKMGRAILIETLSHPLRKVVIRIAPGGKVEIEETAKTQNTVHA